MFNMRNENFLSTQMKSQLLKSPRFSGLFGMSLLLVLLALTTWQCSDDDFTGEVIGVCPEVITTSPSNGAVNVVSDRLVTATFNTAMDPLSINENTFQLMNGVDRVAGSVTYSGLTATFHPAVILHANTVYTATIKRESKDLMGNMMVKDTTWLFNTGWAPSVIFTNPAEGTSDVALNQVITAVFSTAMNPVTINVASFKLMQGTLPVTGTITYSGTTATFTPSAAFLPNKVYSATVNTIVKDVAGNAMKKDTTWSFATGILPLITVTNPVNRSVNVAIDATVSATFSKQMNPVTISPLTFMLKQGTNTVAGVVTYKDMTATFTPASPLLYGVEYTATVSAGVKDLLGKSIPSDSTWKFTTVIFVPPVLPVVLSTDPENAAINVALNKVIRATFSKTMDNSTINSTTFKVMNGTTPVSGTISYVGNIGSFTPISALLNGTTYDVTITTGSKDTEGNAMANDKKWSFTTVNAIPPVLPVVLSTDPENAAINVALNKVIRATFSKTMDNSTINSTTFKVMNGTTPVSGTISYAGNIGSFTPISALLNGTTYDVTITTGSKDTEGNAMANDKKWSFNTPDAIVQYTVAVSAFPSVGGTVEGGGLLASGTMVTVSATSKSGYQFTKWTENGIQVSVAANYSFTLNSNRNLVANFSAVVSGPMGVDLGSAANFAILSGAGVSNTGVTTKITGDVGSFPTATINGLLAGNVNGTLFVVADPIVGLAKSDLTTAYNDAQGRSLNAISLPGQLGGLTLAPGLYVNSSTSGISGTGANGILTLDAGGNPNAVWIFKMGSTLITDAGTSIVLAGGAQAKNIYWSVGTSATLGTNSSFAGNIIADQSITITTGATLIGRALTRIGAVTLDTNIVTKP
jgi:predicted RNA-binding protein with TRAM domain